MSDYQKLKARALELQREKEEDFKRELALKAEKDKQRALDEDEKRKRREALAKESRRLELMRANDELVKRQQAGNAGEGNRRMEYDPFAEDEPRPAPTNSAGSSQNAITAAKPSTKPSTSIHAERSLSRPGPSKPSGTTSKERASPPPLGRKEKAAKRFAETAKKPARSAESVFSIRSLVEGREASGSPAPPAQRIARYVAPTKPTMSMKDRMKKQASVDGMRKLCPDRSTRDRRTIDQIHADIKARKGGDEVPTERSRSASPVKRSRSVSPVEAKPTPKPKPKPIPSTARPAWATPRSNCAPRPSAHADPPERRRASSSPSTSSSATPPPRTKRPRSRSPALDPSSQAAISAQIQAIFRRPGRPEPRRYADSDASSDMEAGLSDVELEEQRTARIARKEDELAGREERERRLAKERSKKERMKGEA